MSFRAFAKPARRPVPDSRPVPNTEPVSNVVCTAFMAAQVRVVAGANVGDAIGGADEVCAGDVYALSQQATPLRLALADRTGHSGAEPMLFADPEGQIVAADSEIGTPGDRAVPGGRLTLMGSDGAGVDLLALTLCRAGDTSASLACVVPLGPIEPGERYMLIASSALADPVRYADLASGGLAAGTRITLADGAQKPIDELAPGDRILTRDHGPQPLRHLLRSNQRAIGHLAPVVIAQGALDNTDDLVISQFHRLYVFQRLENAMFGTPEVLIKAKHLVDDDRVCLRSGGFVEYFNLVFERHEIIYAEGIPVESFLADRKHLASLPCDAIFDLPRVRHRPHAAIEAPARCPDGRSARALLRDLNPERS